MTRALALLLALALLALLGGCYSRTVSTKGIGSYGSNVEESYRSDTAADRWVDSLFAKPKTTTKSRWIETGK